MSSPMSAYHIQTRSRGKPVLGNSTNLHSPAKIARKTLKFNSPTPKKKAPAPYTPVTDSVASSSSNRVFQYAQWRNLKGTIKLTPNALVFYHHPFTQSRCDTGLDSTFKRISWEHVDSHEAKAIGVDPKHKKYLLKLNIVKTINEAPSSIVLRLNSARDLRIVDEEIQKELQSRRAAHQEVAALVEEETCKPFTKPQSSTQIIQSPRLCGDGPSTADYTMSPLGPTSKEIQSLIFGDLCQMEDNSKEAKVVEMEVAETKPRESAAVAFPSFLLWLCLLLTLVAYILSCTLRTENTSVQLLLTSQPSLPSLSVEESSQFLFSSLSNKSECATMTQESSKNGLVAYLESPFKLPSPQPWFQLNAVEPVHSCLKDLSKSMDEWIKSCRDAVVDINTQEKDVSSSESPKRTNWLLQFLQKGTMGGFADIYNQRSH